MDKQQPDDQTQTPTTDTAELLRVRREKLNQMRERGIEPFGGKFEISHGLAALRAGFADEKKVRIAGRVSARRDMGKSIFFDISDIEGRFQCFLNAQNAGDESFATFKELVDICDWVGVDGDTFTTKVGEPSIKVAQLTVLSKSMRPMPGKWHGVVDPEIKYRQRYLDLISNERSREIFVTRSKMIAEMRRYMADRDFLEVETPMMQSVAGGAAARPF